MTEASNSATYCSWPLIVQAAHLGEFSQRLQNTRSFSCSLFMCVSIRIRVDCVFVATQAILWLDSLPFSRFQLTAMPLKCLVSSFGCSYSLLGATFAYVQLLSSSIIRRSETRCDATLKSTSGNPSQEVEAASQIEHFNSFSFYSHSQFFEWVVLS